MHLFWLGTVQLIIQFENIITVLVTLKEIYGIHYVHVKRSLVLRGDIKCFCKILTCNLMSVINHKQ